MLDVLSLEQFLATYGLWAVLVGTFLEGETVMLLAGFAAHQGYLSLGLAILAGLVGSAAFDQVLFWTGRRFGTGILERRERWHRRLLAAKRHLDGRAGWSLVTLRFWFGLRTVTPLALGALRFSPLRFLVIDVLAASLWSAVTATAGFAFGGVMTHIVAKTKRYEGLGFVALAAAGLIFWIAVHLVRRARRSPR